MLNQKAIEFRFTFLANLFPKLLEASLLSDFIDEKLSGLQLRRSLSRWLNQTETARNS